MKRDTDTIGPVTAAEATAAIVGHARHSLGRLWDEVTPREALLAVSMAVRDHLLERMADTERQWRATGAKRVCYLSLEFLMGRSLGNNLINLGLHDAFRQALAGLGHDLDDLLETERDAALGNGGLGRLAACFLDSMATVGIAGHGYGICYEYGLFRQEIDGGRQRERPDNWLAGGTPWLVERPDEACIVPLYGRIEHAADRAGGYNPMWMDWKILVGVPHDMPVAGYGGLTVNALRLFSARATDDFDMGIFNEGDYLRAVEGKIASETVSKVLYPSDAVEAGRELRLVQEYFFTACALHDIVRRHLKDHADLRDLASGVAIQMNDTHPALAVAELMRLLVDEHAMDWDEAFAITRATLGYTNHTLMPEALERWPVALFETVLPRHLQILYEINARFLASVEARWPGDAARQRRMSIVDEGPPRQVRMAHLAIVGSHSINGVAELHTRLVKSDLVPDFHAMWPERFNNKTNGVTQRRWLQSCNPGLAGLLTQSVGDGWITDLESLRALEPFAEDPAFREAFRAVKRRNKEALARVIQGTNRVVVSPDALFDVHAKRIHEYKRQLLQAMHVVHQYLRLVEDGVSPVVPRCFVFAGKAAPGYRIAKEIIRLVNDLSATLRKDPRSRGVLDVVFVPDYRVSLAERIMPAADLSEQISTAGKEASGTGNMKFAMNGALTMGTLDGANVEILEAVGADNIYIFGLTAEEVARHVAEGSYHPADVYRGHPRVQRVLDAITSGRFCPGEPDRYAWIRQRLVDGADEYFHLVDLDACLDAQDRASADFADPDRWTTMAIRNVARMGRFSSDRTIREYARDIWGVVPTR